MASLAEADAVAPRRAILYRMVTPEHRCPWGLRSRWLLRRLGYEVEDHVLASDAETEAFQRREGVETTPQTFIDGRRIGGYEDLRRHFGLKVRDPDAPTYAPVAVLVCTAAALALALPVPMGPPELPQVVARFGALAMILFAVQKLRDLEGFATRFLGYDLLARAWLPYAWVYPFAEFGAGILMLAGALTGLAGAAAFAIGAVGAASVVQAVWVEGRQLKCACVGGSGNVPLGPVSLAENLGMMAMGIWMMLGGAG
jgi:glutaredoxin